MMGHAKNLDFNISPLHNLGQKGSGDKRPFTGGVYLGSSLIEIEKNVKEA